MLEENTARNPEFNYDRFELADMDNSECKANLILPQLAEALHLPEIFCYSQRQKEEKHKDVRGKGISKIKEKLISHLYLINLVIMHDSSPSLSAAHFFILCTTGRRKFLF